MYIYIYVYIYIYIYIYIWQVCIYECKSTYTHNYIHVCTYVLKCVCV